MTPTHAGSGNRTSQLTSLKRWLILTLAAWAFLLAVILGSDGSPGWRIFRVALVVIVAVAAIWVLAHRPRWGAAIALLCGCAALCLAVVFGFYHLAKMGLSWRAIVGLLELVAGFVLLIVGIRLLLSGLALGLKFIAVPVIIVAVLIVTWVIAPAVLATNVPHISSNKSMPQDFGLAAQPVCFAASDGIMLGGWFVPSANQSAVVIRHGSGSTCADVFAQAAILAKHGYGILVTDARGHGMSEGRAMDFGWYGNADIAGAVSFLANQTGIQRIGVVGFSMGGEEAIGAAAADPRISAVVAEGAEARTDADKAWYPEVYGVRGRIQLGLEWIEFSMADLLTEAAKPTALADAASITFPRPVLLITAGEVEDELHAARHIQEHSPANVTIWTVPGAKHTQGLSTAPAGWEKTVIGFLDQALAPK
jgi:uncharacterized protein